ncbi:MAG: YHS domain-containing protein [Chloroflexi bacterium]|nr:YHS domain-containing protein [Chloroflexota bacterium]
MATAIDPVCKMDVDTANPPGGQSEHQGTAYYFCAPGCKVAFDKEPEKYLAEEGAESGESDGHGLNGTESKPGFFARLFGRK